MGSFSEISNDPSGKSLSGGKVIAKTDQYTMTVGLCRWPTVEKALEEFVQKACDRVKKCPLCGDAKLCTISSDDLTTVLKCAGCGQELPIIVRFEDDRGTGFSILEVTEDGKHVKQHSLVLQIAPRELQGGE